MTVARSTSSLACHPSGRCPVNAAIDASANWSRSGEGIFRFVLTADLSLLRIPAEEVSGRADGLWRHTCFEAFIKPRHSPAYQEFNFSPSSQWAWYRFDAYRHGMQAPDSASAPQINVQRFAGRLELTATVTLRDLVVSDAAPLQVGLSAVLEADDGSLTYWALKHAAPQPDFHNAEGFVLDLRQ